MNMLTPLQAKKLAVPLIRNTMGAEIGRRANEEFNTEYEYTDLWGVFENKTLVSIIGLGAELSIKKVWLGYFATHPEYRNRGLGTKALDFIEKVAKNRGYKWILVETYEHDLFDNAIKLYKKLGYKEVGYLADYLDDDSDVLYLRKNLED